MRKINKVKVEISEVEFLKRLGLEEEGKIYYLGSQFVWANDKLKRIIVIEFEQDE